VAAGADGTYSSVNPRSSRMELYMQQQAILAIVLGAIVITGSAVTLALGPRLRTMPLPGGINRWQLESVPLAVTGGLLALSARGSGLSPRTHAIVLAVAVALFASALLCAVAGAAISTRHQRAAHQRAAQQQAARQ
jgi:hypothetical protein